MGVRGSLILALDFGGTKLAAATVEPGARAFRARASMPSPPNKSAEADREIILALAKEVLGGKRPAAVGVSFGGPVREGVVLLSHHVPDWEDFPLAEWLREHFGVPAAVENDANAAALGEWRYGAGRGTRYFLYVTVSTGIGGGIVIGGRLYRGADSLAGEIGHMVVDPGGPRCTCGRRGCLEAFSAGPAIARRARELLASHHRSGEGRIILELVGGDPSRITAREVAMAAARGDPLAAEILREAGEALGFGLAQAIALLNPERVALGGGVVKAGEPFLAHVRKAANAWAFPGARVEIALAELGDDAPLWGAAALAQDLL
ncbi:ROK family protein, partial [Candidatus Acetothermia bacterium]